MIITEKQNKSNTVSNVEIVYLQTFFLNPKTAGCWGKVGWGTENLCDVSKNSIFGERMKPCLFVIFSIIVSHIFPENFFETPQFVQKI